MLDTISLPEIPTKGRSLLIITRLAPFTSRSIFFCVFSCVITVYTLNNASTLLLYTIYFVRATLFTLGLWRCYKSNSRSYFCSSRCCACLLLLIIWYFGPIRNGMDKLPRLDLREQRPALEVSSALAGFKPSVITCIQKSYMVWLVLLVCSHRPTECPVIIISSRIFQQ